jgi:sugar (pentulose or hexulose) kinase
VPAGAGEGGAWGMALLAAYSIRDDRRLTLPDYLDDVVGDTIGEAIAPTEEDIAGFQHFFDRYTAGLPIEAAAVEHFR